MKNKEPGKTPGEPEEGEFRHYLRFSTLGIEIGVALAIGLLIGWYLDRLFGTRPWLMIVFMIFGIAAGFRNIVLLARKDWDGDSGNGGDSP